VQHSRRKPVVVPEPRAPERRLVPSVTPTSVTPVLGKICPTCREEYPPEAAYCPNDGNRLIAARGATEPHSPGGGVCPICGQGYDPGVLVCAKHGEELVPAAMQAAARSDGVSLTKTICPMCGNRYEGDSQFCGGCGASLVPMN
jgi:predicted amidophosphoribosyltransferase